jgi:hypothetical protein
MKTPATCTYVTVYIHERYNICTIQCPKERRLGSAYTRIVKQGKTRLERVWHYSYDVSLEDSLTQLLNNEAVLQEVRNKRTRQDGSMWDYSDGSQFKEHLLYKDHPEALQIHLYFDELEVCNPLGSRALKHKLGLFYYTLGNIRPELRSTLMAI